MTEITKCPSCQRSAAPDDKFCGGCGKPLVRPLSGPVPQWSVASPPPPPFEKKTKIPNLIQGSLLGAGGIALGYVVYYFCFAVLGFDDNTANVISFIYMGAVALVAIILTQKFAQKKLNQWYLLGGNLILITLAVLAPFLEGDPDAQIIVPILISSGFVFMVVVNLLICSVRNRLGK